MHRYIIIPLLALLLAACDRPSKTNAPGSEDKNYTHVQASDDAMNACIKKAKETTQQFTQALQAPKSSFSDFAVKKPYPTPTGGAEHMWIVDVKATGDHYSGTIANDAYETTAVKMGQVVTFSMHEVTDWKYLDGNKLKGGYTIRYFYDKMSLEEKKQFLSEAGFQIDPVP